MNLPQQKRSGIAVGIVILLFAAIMAWQTAIIPTGGGYAQVGPTAIPWLVVAMIAVLGAIVTVQAATGWWMVGRGEHGPLHSRSLIWIGIALTLNLVLISYLGFILASTAMFLCAARGFGSTRPVRDAGIGFSLAFIAYFGFDRLLGYQIGGGLIENLI